MKILFKSPITRWAAVVIGVLLIGLLIYFQQTADEKIPPMTDNIAESKISSVRNSSRLRRNASANPELASSSFENSATASPQQATATNPSAVPRVISAGFPVALSIAPPELAQLFPEEQALIHELQVTFDATMTKAPSQDIDSPEYFDHWKRAVRASDERLLLILGGDRFNRVTALARAHVATP